MERDPDSNKSGYSSNSYLVVLRDQIPRVYEPGRIFMQDNVSIHTAKKVKKWFEDEGVELLEWPLYSSDLNPIEHLWTQLKHWINEHYPELRIMSKSEEDYQCLFQAIREGWDDIGQEAVVNLIKNMDTRVNAVLNAKGWYIRF